MLNPQNIGSGEEQHEIYNDRVTKKRRCQYDYRANDGTMFSCVRATLQDCRAARDEWIKRDRKEK